MTDSADEGQCMKRPALGISFSCVMAESRLMVRSVAVSPRGLVTLDLAPIRTCFRNVARGRLAAVPHPALRNGAPELPDDQDSADNQDSGQEQIQQPVQEQPPYPTLILSTPQYRPFFGSRRDHGSYEPRGEHRPPNWHHGILRFPTWDLSSLPT